MKIGILTFWWSNDNYGQLLQCYALQKYLRDAGHEAFLIRYNFCNDIIPTPLVIRALKACNPVITYRYLKRKFHISKKISQNSNDRCFDEFRKKYIVQSEIDYTDYEMLCNIPPVADVYIVGSDQVWNFNWITFYKIKNIIHAYMLDFGAEEIQRLSYAASWAVNTLSKNLKEEIIPLLKKFSYISVRERTGMDLCAQCERPDAEWVCDPTYLLDADEYRKLYNENKIRTIQEKYILVYMLGNACEFNIQDVLSYAHEKNLKVVYIPGTGAEFLSNSCTATIPEWLYFIDNAEYIISNSFHCGIFSIIFQKQFGIVPLTGRFREMNGRFESLFSAFGMPQRYIQKNNFSILDKKYTITKPLFKDGTNLLAYLKNLQQRNR